MDKITAYPKVTRVEVIGPTSREYTNYGAEKVEIAFQDDGRTIKVFIGRDFSGEYKKQGESS